MLYSKYSHLKQLSTIYRVLNIKLTDSKPRNRRAVWNSDSVVKELKRSTLQVLGWNIDNLQILWTEFKLLCLSYCKPMRQSTTLTSYLVAVMILTVLMMRLFNKSLPEICILYVLWLWFNSVQFVTENRRWQTMGE